MIKLFSLASCAVTVPSFDFVKDDCAVGSAVLGKMGYNLSSTQSMVLFHENQRKKVFWADRKRSNGFFDGARNVAGCIYDSRKSVSDYCSFNYDASCWHKNAPIRHKRWNYMIFHPVHYEGKGLQKSRFVLNNPWRHTFSDNIYYKMRIVANRTGFYKVSVSTENIIHVQYII